ncbi:hypothetical protein RND71_019173 [Anisodus tanguticus]|uniref:60S acidic ribosomal protein P1 n=1 Tax=Anisodus tanguticus TaxID=243964 RepID=A0AAE1VE11_9SOLA|nr:hypothetical protein RND71_019173 [Anisodus tanguticus]
MSSTGELSCTYACLILHDDGIPITGLPEIVALPTKVEGEKIGTLVRASNLEVESYWPSLFAKLCEKKNVNELIMNVAEFLIVLFVCVFSQFQEEAKEESDDEAMFSLFD